MKIGYPGNRSHIQRCPFPVQIMKISGNGYHGSIVRSELELRKIGSPPAFLSFFRDRGTQSAIGGNSATYGYLPDAGGLGGLDEFVHKNLYQSPLEAGTDIFLVLLQELRIIGHAVADEIQKRGLDSAETVVITGHVRFREMESVRIPLLRKPVHHRASGIPQPHHLRTLVEGLAHGIVYGLPHDFEIQRTVHPDYLGIPS